MLSRAPAAGKTIPGLRRGEAGMISRRHIPVGVAAYLEFATVTGTLTSPLGLAVAALGGVTPDIDPPGSRGDRS
jgi:hypothetical protein